MSRIKAVMSQLKSDSKSALIPYITGGDPEPGLTVELMHELVSAGADIIELGIPFSDPMADGPVIQLACERALEHNVSLEDVLSMVSTFRQTDSNTPVVLMGYLNPVVTMGYSQFASKAAEAGVDGVLVVDLPPEEGGKLLAEMKKHDLDSVYLIAPTTTEDRIEAICEASSGYVYYVSVKGVTGSASLDVDSVAEKLAVIRGKSDIPVGVGFGIKDAESAAAVAKVADGVIVGSVLVNTIAANINDHEAIKSKIYQIMSSMRQAMDA
ncbi:tryptophan synthase subunit alpha [Alkalimarinus sediminis]|uniref:Tryptophan synthase alpha chain n=1 Tax=Alkalimarinus sediminis TaxID=1632866 RepID=A0A9E8KRH2_9ALTE|nr:tryptophan synthase subunit alpha [Alkalimarinus sediminis]UZW76057.1 tryptophan synthase subunit alpha [Alkalimarinus sediminis]